MVGGFTNSVGLMSGSGAHVKACISGLGNFLSSSPCPAELRRGLFARDSEEELERRLGVDVLRRELPLTLVEPLRGAGLLHLTSLGLEGAVVAGQGNGT